MIEHSKKVIALGSGPNLKIINNFDTSGIRIVGTNNVWKGTDKWDHMIVAGDYPERKYIKKKLIPIFKKKGIIKTRHAHKGKDSICDAILAYDNKSKNSTKDQFNESAHYLGFPMYFAVTYWCLHFLKPDYLGFLGFDMDYTPSSNGSTAFYGVGHDIKTRGVPDPLYVMKKYYNNDPNYMQPLFQRLKSRLGKTKLLNLSDNPNSRLPWAHITLEGFKNL